MSRTITDRLHERREVAQILSSREAFRRRQADRDRDSEKWRKLYAEEAAKEHAAYIKRLEDNQRKKNILTICFLLVCVVMVAVGLSASR